MEKEPSNVDCQTEALDSVRLDSVATVIKQWASEADKAPGGTALSDMDSLENVLDLTGSHPAGIAQLYSGRITKLSALFRDPLTLGSARSVLSRIDSEKLSSLARYGLYPTYIVMGVASWTQLPPFKDAQRALRPELSYFKLQHFNMPVLLRPLELEATGNEFTLQIGCNAIVNPILESVFSQRGIKLDASKTLNTAGENNFDYHATLDLVRELGQSHIPGFGLEENTFVANLGVSGTVLASDWHQVSAKALENPLVRVFAGDDEARKKLAEPLPKTPAEDRDPDFERGIGDLDVSQERVVEMAACGRSVFVDVPPGAPGVATVQAVLADAAASGKQVCYVPGVRRIGEAVLAGLKQVGLGDFVLNLTGTTEWRASLRDQILSASVQPEIDSPVPVEELSLAHAKLRATREKLQEYTRRLHLVRNPWAVSAYEVLQSLADLTSLKPGPRTKIKLDLNIPALAKRDSRIQARKLLEQAETAGLLDPKIEASPWRSVVLSTAADAADAVSRIHELADGKITELRKYQNMVSEQTGLVLPDTLNAWKEQLGMLQGVAQVLEFFKPEVFEKSAADMVIATASKRWRQERSLPMKWKKRRELLHQIRELAHSGVAPRSFHEELVKVQSYRDLWRRHALPGAWPRIPQDLSQIKKLSEEVFSKLQVLEPIIVQADGLAGRDPSAMPISELESMLTSMDATSHQARQMPAQVQLLKKIQQCGLEPLLDDLRERKVKPELIPQEFDLAWWSSILTEILKNDPILAAVDATALHEMVARLRSLDLAQIESLPYPVARAIFVHSKQVLSSSPKIAKLMQQVLVSKSVNELGDFTHLAPLVKVIRPIWALSPFIAGQLYGSDSIDLLVLDHMDYLTIAQVMPLVARAKQLVVWGDSRRGWPGFTKSAAKVLPKLSLRSEMGELPEQVAAFLASHGYEGSVVPVPSPRPASLVNLHIVPDASAPLSRDHCLVMSRPEIHKVVELCLDHALNRPYQSLAVVCFNPAGVPKIRKALADARVKIPQAQTFFSHPRGRPAVEPFVVVDSSQAAGLRRDVVILCLGMSKTPQGRVQLNFGPVSGESGVAHVVGSIEVVRQKLEIVSAFRAEEIDAGKVKSPGARMLVDLLISAGKPEGMARALTTEESYKSQPDRLLVDLAERLWRQGLTVVPRFGLPKGIQIPLALGHADLPAELLVAVLTDDESYVNEPSLRRRERLWPARLEAAGWKVITCYTNEVFADPQAQAQRVTYGVSQALRARKHQLAAPIIATPQFETEAEDAGKTSGNKKLVHHKKKGSVEPGSEEAKPAGVESAGDTHGAKKPHLQLVGKPRGKRPPIAKGLPLAAYGDDQLDDLLEWICSDGIARSEDEQVKLLREALNLSKRGAQVDAVLRHVVQRRNAAL